jgi:hypothetical protein
MPPTQRSTKGRGNATQTAKDRPVKVVRIRDLRANIWANRIEGGGIIYNATFDRLWKEDDEVDGQGEVTRKGEWKQSGSFGKDDLLLLGKIADLAHTWIYRRLQDDRREESF